MCLEGDLGLFLECILMSGAYSDEKPLKTSEKCRCTEIFVLGTFHATTVCLSSPSCQMLLCLFCVPWRCCLVCLCLSRLSLWFG